jgi:hypothetical protein
MTLIERVLAFALIQYRQPYAAALSIAANHKKLPGHRSA